MTYYKLQPQSVPFVVACTQGVDTAKGSWQQKLFCCRMINVFFKVEPPQQLWNPYEECHTHLSISTYTRAGVLILWLNYVLIVLIFDDTWARWQWFPKKWVIIEQLLRINYDSFSTAGLCFADKICRTLSQIHGVYIRNCIMGHNI